MSRGYSVAHQKVDLEVDLLNSCLRGTTDLTIIPTNPDLKRLQLSARQLTVHEVFLNSKPASFTHNDTITLPPKPQESWGANQYHLYKEKLGPSLSSEMGLELSIDIPEEISITGHDKSSTFIVSPTATGESYEPLTLRIVYSVLGSTAGINFVGGLKDPSVPRAAWHAYTLHTNLGLSTSCWVPCCDLFSDLCTWELEFLVPKTVKRLQPTQETEDEEDPEQNSEAEREIFVVSHNATPAQIIHQHNSPNKIVRYELFTPIFAHHLGFVVGALQHVPMAVASDEESGTSTVPVSVFCLPELANRVPNVCSIFPRAMEFFTRDFGSYPFSAYSICFVNDLPRESMDAAALTICSSKLLFTQTAIEPLFQYTEPLIRCLATQWCGVNISAASWGDIWVTEGIAGYMTQLFVRKLMGNNEYSFRIRKYMDEITKVDVNMMPLGAPSFEHPVSVSDLDFIRLKAPMVLYILDRRMTRTDRSLGLSRVIPKLLLQSMSGDLHSKVSTAHFRKICEKVAHHRLDRFFDEWVFKSGYPIFRVTQRFNKKRMFVEMGIGQVHSREIPPEFLNDVNYVSRAVQEIANHETSVVDVFTGPMTIRIHEADGTPYEHVVDLRSSFTKLDIQYNTKYKRLKRNQKFRSGDEDTGGLIHCLGDVLMKERDIDSWRLSDWGQDEEEFMFNEAFEWIRVDSDFEWICKMYVGQPDYMYASQLQQDRDVVAQYDAVSYFSTQVPNAIHSSILVRTLMDSRYYYGVRIHAALGLARCATEATNYIGQFHLLKAFQSLYCFEDSLIPRANDFQDFASYFVQKAIPIALSMVRDKSGKCPAQVSSFLLDLIRYNENSGNVYSDSYYLCSLITAVVNTLRPLDGDSSLIDHTDPALKEFVTKVSAEMDKAQRLDHWLPSPDYIVSCTVVAQNELMIRAGYGEPRFDKLLLLTKNGVDPDIRLASFQTLLAFGGYKKDAIMKYVCYTLENDPQLRMRVGLMSALVKTVGAVAIHGEYTSPAQIFDEEPEDLMKLRQKTIARRVISTSIPVLRESLGKNECFAKHIFHLLTSSGLPAYERRRLFEICSVVYEPRDKLIVTLATPKIFRLGVKRKGASTVVFKYRSLLERKAPKKEEARPALKLKLGLKL